MRGLDPALASATSTGLLEREAELATVGGWLDRVSADRGGMLLIEGPAGVGKSTLIDHVRDLARERFFVLSAAGREVEQALGWGVARSLFEPWVLRLSHEERADLLSGPAASARLLLEPEAGGAALPAADASFAILHGLYWLTARAAEPGPALLIVDDAHWADEPSLRLLSYLLGRIADQPIGLLVGSRSSEEGAAGLLAVLAADRSVTVCEPAPLSAGAVRTLIRAQMPDADDGFCRRCWELTAGNPLGVRELLRAIADSASADLDAIAERAARSLSRSVLRRLAALPPNARALADAVSVLESGVELQWAADIADLQTSAALAAADQLARADILLADDPLSFTHPLLCTTVYKAMPRGVRAELHRRAAAVLLAAHAPVENAAAHLLESPPAGDPDVVEILREAARRAMTQGVPASACGYLERALREPPTEAVRPDILAELGRAEANFAPRRAIEHLGAAIDLTGERSRRATLALELGRAMHDAGHPDDACVAFERGMAELGEASGELAIELEACYLTSAVLVPARAPDAHARVEPIIARSRGLHSPAARLLASKALIMRVYAGDPCEPLARQARELYAGGRLLDEGGLISQALAHVCAGLSYADQYAAAAEVVTRAREEARRRGWVTWFAAASQLRARVRQWTGPIPDVIADATTAVDIYSSGHHLYLPAAAYCLARGLIDADDLTEAESVLERVEREDPPRGVFAAWHHEARGRLAAATGQWERALEEFRACGKRAMDVLVSNPALFHWRSEAGAAALRVGQEALARELISEELLLAERFGARRTIGVARRAAAMLEDGPAREEALSDAAELFAACGARVELAETLVELGRAIRRGGRPAEARETLRRALALAEELGALRWVRVGRDELQRAGGRPPARSNGVDALTPSERRVAELAAAGRTNREIANELFVTVKAVEWHLGNSYRKLDVRGRRELGGALQVAKSRSAR